MTHISDDDYAKIRRFKDFIQSIPLYYRKYLLAETKTALLKGIDDEYVIQHQCRLFDRDSGNLHMKYICCSSSKAAVVAVEEINEQIQNLNAD